MGVEFLLLGLTPSLLFLAFQRMWIVETTFLFNSKILKVLHFKLKILFGLFWKFIRWTLEETVRQLALFVTLGTGQEFLFK